MTQRCAAAGMRAAIRHARGAVAEPAPDPLGPDNHHHISRLESLQCLHFYLHRHAYSCHSPPACRSESLSPTHIHTMHIGLADREPASLQGGLATIAIAIAGPKAPLCRGRVKCIARMRLCSLHMLVPFQQHALPCAPGSANRVRVKRRPRMRRRSDRMWLIT